MIFSIIALYRILFQDLIEGLFFKSYLDSTDRDYCSPELLHYCRLPANLRSKETNDQESSDVVHRFLQWVISF